MPQQKFSWKACCWISKYKYLNSICEGLQIQFRKNQHIELYKLSICTDAYGMDPDMIDVVNSGSQMNPI